MIRTYLAAVLALAPAALLAQDGGAVAVSEDDRALGLALEGSARSVDEGRGAVPPPDTYSIRPGDTLWDLSGRFLNNPWYWPKIWSYNPEITNPHWIYPGNLLRFYPSAEEAPTRVEPLDAIAAAEQHEEEDFAEPVRELEDFSRADMQAPPSVEEQDAVAVAGPYKIAYVPSRTRYARHDTFVTPRELAESGAISAAFDEKKMLSTQDRAYARFRGATDAQLGETYVVYKTDRAIHHPETKELFGYQSSVLGAAKVVAVDERAVTVVITHAFDPIERGALLGPWTEKPYRPVPRRANRRALDGRIIATQAEVVTMLGEHHVVFVDRGEADGVEAGNLFTVVRAGDPYGRDTRVAGWDARLPKEDVGQLLVIDVKERASAALVMRSLKELIIGDRVELRSEAGSGGN
jgi:hypothetical protein